MLKGQYKQLISWLSHNTVELSYVKKWGIKMFVVPQKEEKPYNLCLNCIHIGEKCDGPNFLAMTTERWCEWCRLRKEYLGWTNAHVADIAGISKVSVDRIMSGNVKDLRTTTVQAVTKALVNGSWGQYPCSMAADSEKEQVFVDSPELVNKCSRLQNELDEVHQSEKRKVDFLKVQIAFMKDQLSVKDMQLRDRLNFIKRKDKIIFILAILLALTISTIMSALIVDKLNPGIGFFWL